VAPPAEEPLGPAAVPPTAERTPTAVQVVEQAAPQTRPRVLSPAKPTPRLELTRYASTGRANARTLLRSYQPRIHLGQWRSVLRIAGVAATNGGPPLLLVLLAIGFLAVQDRIDRNDPKLALAPVHRHQRLAFRRNDLELP
jgi:hypothetical protein